MQIIYYIPIALFFSILRIVVEYDYFYKREYRTSLLRIRTFMISILLCSTYYASGYEAMLIFLFSYWNTYEFCCNYFHNNNIFYVGEISVFDKFIRSFSTLVVFDYYRVKFILHFISIVLIVILLIR